MVKARLLAGALNSSRNKPDKPRLKRSGAHVRDFDRLIAFPVRAVQSQAVQLPSALGPQRVQVIQETDPIPLLGLVCPFIRCV